MTAAMATWVSRALVWPLLGAVVVLDLGCGGTSLSVEGPDPQAPRMAPLSTSERSQALLQFAERAFATLQSSDPVALVFDDVALRRLLNSPSATRASAMRNGMPRHDGRVAVGFELLQGTRFAGACFQAVRDEPAGTLIGLKQPGWVFERMLLVGEEPTGRVALWVEGEFLWTDAGFGALAIHGVERPRRGHADLELAVCDVDLGVQRPLDVVSVSTFNH